MPTPTALMMMPVKRQAIAGLRAGRRRICSTGLHAGDDAGDPDEWAHDEASGCRRPATPRPGRSSWPAAGPYP